MSTETKRARARMINRILHLDAEDDEEREPKKNYGGNTRIPFGLCKRYGIDLPDNASPKDAWDALEGKGIKAQEVFKHLKEAGSVKDFKPKEKTATPKDIKIENLDIEDSDKTMLTLYQREAKRLLDKYKDFSKIEYIDYGNFESAFPTGQDSGRQKLLQKFKEKNEDDRHESDAEKVLNSTYNGIRGIEHYSEAMMAIRNYKAEKAARTYGDMYKENQQKLEDAIGHMKEDVAKIADGAESEIKTFLTDKIAELQEISKDVDAHIVKEDKEKLETLRGERKERQKRADAHRGEKRKTGLKHYNTFYNMDALCDELGVYKSDMDKVAGMNLDRGNDIYNALATMHENYKVHPKYIFADGPTGNTRMGWEAGEYGGLHICSVEPKDNTPTKAKYKRWTVGKDTNGDVIHECGHAIMYSKITTWTGYADFERLANEAEYLRGILTMENQDAVDGGKLNTDDIYDMIEVEREKRFPNDFQDAHIKEQYKLFLDINKAHYKAQMNGDVENLSQYGDTCDLEFFAECFTAYVTGEKMPDYMIDMVEEFID